MKKIVPDGWRSLSLEKCCEILDSRRVPVNSEVRESRIIGKEPSLLFPYFGATGQVGLIDGYLFDEEIVLLGEDGLDFFNSLKPKAYLVTGKCWVNNHAHVLRGRQGIISNAFLRYFLNQFDYRGYVTGTTRQKLNQAKMKTISISLPEFSLQGKIVAKLDSLLARVESCRAHLDRAAAAIKRFRQSILSFAISGKLTNNGNSDKRQEKDWKAVLLGDVLSDIRYGTAKKCGYDSSKVPVLRIPNVVEGRISHNDLKFADFDAAERDKLALKDGDLVMIRSNGSVGLVGRTALITERESGFLFAGYLIRLRCNSTKIHPSYLSLLLESPEARKWIEITARSTSGVNNINSEEIKSFPVNLPPIKEQEAIVKYAGTLLSLIKSYENSISEANSKIEKLEPSVLAKAFRGELV